MNVAARRLERDEPDAERVLTQAFLRASALLGLEQRDVARLLGVSPASASRLASGARTIRPETKEGELAILFLRLFRSLDSLLDGDTAGCKAWLHAENTHLDGVPATLIHSVQGLVHVIEYLDAMRGKL